MTLDQAFSDCVGDDLGQQGDRANSVVVAGNRILEVLGIGVCVENSDHWNAQLFGLVDGEVLAQWINHPDCAGSLLQVTNPTQRLLQLGQLTFLQQEFFLGETLSSVLVVDLFEFFHATQTLGHGLEVGEKTTQPPLVDIGLAHACCLLGNRLLGLFLCADKQNGATVGDRLFNEVVGLIDERERLLQIDDVDSAALGKDKTLDFRIPATGLVAKVHTTIE